MGPLGAFSHILALLFLAFSAYFLLTLRFQARAQRLRVAPRAAVEPALPQIAT